MFIQLRTIAAGLAATALLAGGAAAQPAAPASEAEAARQASPSKQDTPFAQDRATDDATLEKATAREDLALTGRSEQTSTVTGNSVNGTSTTGEISFNDNAFQTASGLTVINANSGNNVSMNASMNVNIVMVPATPPQQ